MWTDMKIRTHDFCTEGSRVTAPITPTANVSPVLGQPSTPMPLGHLPCELFLLIANLCDTQSLARLTQTCKAFHGILDAEKIQRGLNEALLPADVYKESYFYEEHQIPGIDRPIRLGLGATPFGVTPPPPLSRRGFNSEGRLVSAVQRGKIHGVKALLDMGVDPNSYGCSGVWILHIACHKQDMEMVNLLLRYGADPCLKDISKPQVALEHAAWDDKITQRLIMAGTDLSAPRDIASIVVRNSIETITMALEKWRDVKAVRPDRPSLVQSAVLRGDEDVLRVILAQPESGDMLNDISVFYGTALHVALKNKKENLALILIAAGIDVDRKGPDGITGLHVALQYQCFDVARGLIEGGCALDCLTLDGQTELHFAVRVRSVEMVRLLLSKGVDVDLAGPHEESVIYRAIQAAHVDIIRAILTEGRHRPDLTVKGHRGRTPLELAELLGNEEAVRMLVG
ncbi:hypothetical protein N7454_009737 [Penicillium verhagenii]|nr:hypothetical protein N7454_009737 [Penicillium verhagenii]